jgi:hypothetical protein
VENIPHPVCAAGKLKRDTAGYAEDAAKRRSTKSQAPITKQALIPKLRMTESFKFPFGIGALNLFEI